MSDEEHSLVGDSEVPRQFGEDIIEPGEPFSRDTLATIRSLVAESGGDSPVPPAPLKRAGWPSENARSEDVENPRMHAPVPGREEVWPLAEGQADTSEEFEEVGPVRTRSWRKLDVVEGLPGRVVREIAISPRRVAVFLLVGVVIWKPWFIPVLALTIVFLVLLTGVVIGQDRVARIVLYLIQRFVWADPERGRRLQRLVPRKWHWVLYKPIREEDAWEGPIDPRFAERLARLGH